MGVGVEDGLWRSLFSYEDFGMLVFALCLVLTINEIIFVVFCFLFEVSG